MKCKLSKWGCVYHACLTDDCQKDVVLSQGENFGFGRCEYRTEQDKLILQIQQVADSDTFPDRRVVVVQKFYNYVLKSETLPIEFVDVRNRLYIKEFKKISKL